MLGNTAKEVKQGKSGNAYRRIVVMVAFQEGQCPLVLEYAMCSASQARGRCFQLQCLSRERSYECGALTARNVH